MGNWIIFKYNGQDREIIIFEYNEKIVKKVVDIGIEVCYIIDKPKGEQQNSFFYRRKIICNLEYLIQ